LDEVQLLVRPRNTEPKTDAFQKKTNIRRPKENKHPSLFRRPKENINWLHISALTTIPAVQDTAMILKFKADTAENKL
jgi:hypothetical protein